MKPATEGQPTAGAQAEPKAVLVWAPVASVLPQGFRPAHEFTMGGGGVAQHGGGKEMDVSAGTNMGAEVASGAWRPPEGQPPHPPRPLLPPRPKLSLTSAGPIRQLQMPVLKMPVLKRQSLGPIVLGGQGGGWGGLRTLQTLPNKEIAPHKENIPAQGPMVPMASCPTPQPFRIPLGEREMGQEEVRTLKVLN